MKKLLMSVLFVFCAMSAFAQTTQTNPDSIPFAPAVNYGAGYHPFSLFCADLDADTDLDLAVADANSYFVFILKNNGDGTFQAADRYHSGDYPYSLFCADLDGDGDIDLAVANHLWNNISILKNNGNGNFQGGGSYGVGSRPTSVFCADVDGDTDLDLVVANSSSNNVSILKNNGDGSFQSAVDYAAGGSSIFCADLDGDMDLDIVTSGIYILKNNGDGTFQDAVEYPGGGSSVFCADLDEDGDLDLAVASGSSVYILKNNGDGTFANAVNYGAAEGPRSIFCADLDGDVHPDLAVANEWSANVSILKNNGDGTFQDAVNYGAGDFPFCLFCGDLDGDGDLDLAVANMSSHNVSILKNLTQAPANQPPWPFSLISPENGDTICDSTTFQWHIPYDPNFGDQMRYDFYVSTSPGFEPQFTTIDSNLAVSKFTTLIYSGTYYWKVKAKDNWGAATWSIQTWSFVAQEGLVADFSAEPESGFVPLHVQCTDLSEGNPTSWLWDFGDDTSDTLPNPTHTYYDTGYFDIKLVVSNSYDTDSLIREDYIHVLPPIPVLSWADQPGYLTDGVSPDTGLEGTIFTFRVVYSDAYNLPPQSGYPKVNIDLNGDGDFEDENEGSFTMGVVDVDTNYVDGREYLYNATLPVSSNCQYSFSAKNSYGLDAVGEPTDLKEGPVILDPAGELDLYIHASDITFSNQNPDEGETFTVYATVHNNSDSNLTNVSVTYYHSGELLDQVLLSSIPSHGSATASTELSFDTKGFYPIRVVVDEENSFQEWNELNNFAMRPVIVGDYVFPGGIVVQAQLNSPVYPHSWITVTGNAHYTPEHFGAVSGASVTITIQETGAEYTTHTNDPGNFSMGFYGPSEVGSYSVIVEVTDYTLTDSTILNLDVLPPQSGVDLTIRISLPQTDCLLENQEYTVEATIFNLGDQDAQDFWTCIYKDGSLHHSYWVDQLPAGGSLQIDTTISFSSIGWHTVTGIVDVGDSVSEYNEGNNISSVNVHVACDAPDITITNVVFSDHTPKGGQPIDITAWVVNLGAVAVSETFGVEFSDNGIPFDTQYVTSLAPCGTQTAYVVSGNFVYSDTMSHSFSIFADFENVIAECNEENNIYWAAFSVFPDLWPRNLQFSTDSTDCFTWGDSL
ncbi:MAG: VCBS repeat-containing protein, partial [candidate division Zixibacteria bacterium]|nr:VCBS repeat-containing protein [candidate division Zixibacteria bacterium]